MEAIKKSVHPEWAIKHRKPGTEVRKIGKGYYLYEYKTKYDPKKKMPKKVTGKILGAITEKDGFKPSPKRLAEEYLANQGEKSTAKAIEEVTTTKIDEKVTTVNIDKIQCKEFGVASLITGRLKPYYEALQKIFGEDASQIIAIAYCRFLYQSPLKNIPFRLEKSLLPEMLGIKKVSEKAASAMLNKLGGMQTETKAYMKSFITPNDHILLDMTNICSKSKHIDLAQKGYNSKMDYVPQLNLLYVFSEKNKMPIYYRLLPGNIREIKAFKNTLLEAGLQDSIVIADKGFYSAANAQILCSEKLKFILPLRRNNSLINYSDVIKDSFNERENRFKYGNKFIWFKKYTLKDGSFLYLYLDDWLKTTERMDYLARIESHPESYSIEAFHKKKHTYGTMAILSNLDESGSSIYQTYKTRNSIEIMFDSMKNVLDADHTYMQNKQTLEGWMFINHIALQWYQEVYLRGCLQS